MSSRRRSMWILVTAALTALAVGAGMATMHYLDRRSGLFVLSTSPVVAFSVIYLSGIWRRASA